MTEELFRYIPRIEDENSAAVSDAQSGDGPQDEGNEQDLYYYPHELQLSVPGIGQKIDALQSGAEFQVFQTYMDDFAEFMADLNLRHFQASEFLFLGGSHYAPGACRGLNEVPPRSLWPSIRTIAIAVDEVRERLGAPILFNSVYRNMPYNACVDGVSGSFHLQFNAIDFRCLDGNRSGTWAAMAGEVRGEGLFTGGIGIYNTFVHIDSRGVNRNWDNRG
ncbi:MAG: D-Ala-D-Ala carboxypeptidase family metallohydrolase [Pseudomonadota bacterium]